MTSLKTSFATQDNYLATILHLCETNSAVKLAQFLDITPNLSEETLANSLMFAARESQVPIIRQLLTVWYAKIPKSINPAAPKQFKGGSNQEKFLYNVIFVLAQENNEEALIHLMTEPPTRYAFINYIDSPTTTLSYCSPGEFAPEDKKHYFKVLFNALEADKGLADKIKKNPNLFQY